MTPSIILRSFSELDLSDMQLPMLVVFNQNTQDFPGKFVIRIWEGISSSPTNCAMLFDSYEELERSIPFTFHKINRDPQDDPNILEVWV